ncbi:MAG: hypothetical protein A3K46_06705 [Chloroflexi bacterium RBG_13_60_9]|nr:MAG: hypothetical protein A3K46_06705 [Chloroflexi bacterium RBG_13_60_9]
MLRRFAPRNDTLTVFQQPVIYYSSTEGAETLGFIFREPPCSPWIANFHILIDKKNHENTNRMPPGRA